MLKMFYKMKNKHGMVLFFVVMMMAILIIMSTAAYYTARNSYNTVVSNYDFEQMYLSATSISDIIMDSINSKNGVLSGATADKNGASINQLNVTTGALKDLKEKAFKAVFGAHSSDADYFAEADGTINFTSISSLDPIIIRTANITDLDKVKNDQRDTISLDLGASGNSSLGGSLDGAYVKIQLQKAILKGSPSWDPITPTPGVVNTGTAKYDVIFTITTTAFYRDNYIIVEDVIVEDGVEVKKECNAANVPGTPDIPGGEGSEDDNHEINLPGTPGTPGSNGGKKTFFTATGQSIKDGEKDNQTRSVVIKTHEITDNAYFENDYTYFIEGNSNDFKGGIRSSGTVVLEKFTTNLPAPTDDVRHDWVINGDLIITDANSNDIDLNGNNLYVKGNIIVLSNGFSLEAANIYCGKDFYCLAPNSTSTITGNMYVGADVKMTPDDNVRNIISQVYSKYAEAESINPLKSPNNTGYTDGGTLKFKNSTDEFVVNGNVVKGSSSVAPTPNEGSWDNSTKVPGTEPQYDKDGNVLKDENGKVITDTTVGGMYTSANKSQEMWGSAQIKQETFNNNLTIDIQNISSLDNMENNGKKPIPGSDPGSVIGYTYDYTLDDGTQVHVEKRNNSNNINFTYTSSAFVGSTDENAPPPATAVYDTSGNGALTVNVPYTENGYNLNIDYMATTVTEEWGHQDENYQWIEEHRFVEKTESIGNGGQITYNFGTEDGKTMPVLLQANFNDGKGTNAPDANGNNAFSWRGDKVTMGSPQEAKIQLVASDDDGNVDASTTASGNVAFTMSDYTKPKDSTEAAGFNSQYAIYNKLNSAGLTSATYYTSENETIGTKAQVDAINQQHQSEGSALKAMLGANSVPKTDPDYNNRLIIASNKVNGVAIDGTRKDNTICGYVYAPNSAYDTQGMNGGNSPVFGGMIVSTYTSDLGNWVYAVPDDSIIDDLLAGLGLGYAGDPAVPGKTIIVNGKKPTTTPGTPGTPSSTPKRTSWNNGCTIDNGGVDSYGKNFTA